MFDHKRPPLTEEQRLRRNNAVRKHQSKKRATDPAWLEARRAYSRAYNKKQRLDPEVRKLHYKKHTEWARKNKEHINKKQRQRNKQPENKLKQRIYRLKKYYGLTHEEYQNKINTQNGACPICIRELGNSPAVDHNHETGQVRGVLCKSCNCWIGFVEKNPTLLEPMKNYLKKWAKPESIQGS